MQILKESFLELEADIEEDDAACPICGIYSDWRTDSSASFRLYFNIAGLLVLGGLLGFMLALKLQEAGCGRLPFVCNC
jgi:hypothetical protein